MPIPAIASDLWNKWTPISRRNSEIEQLESRLAAAREELAEARQGLSPAVQRRALAQHRRELARTPSFQREVFKARRLALSAKEMQLRGTSVIGHGKQYILSLMASHGVDIPRTLGTWDRVEDIEWDQLPDLVVLKGTRGAGSRGVYPLQRVGDKWLILTHQAPVTTDDIIAEIRGFAADALVAGPYYAEEFLGTPDGEIPVDIKVYAFYGKAPIVLLRQVQTHGDRKAATFRVVDRDGNDVVKRYHDRPTDTSIPLPRNLAQAIETAEHVSTIVRAPFTRVDLYEHDGRVVFGEVTPRPGGNQWLGAEMDRLLGEHWEEAEIRLWNSRTKGEPLLPELGPLQP